VRSIRRAQSARCDLYFEASRDPLDWLSDRGSAWATANADGETLELPVYITRDEVQRRVEASAGQLEAALGSLGEAALVTATQCQGSILSGAHPDLAFQGTIPRLLDHPAGSGSVGAPRIDMRSAGWEPVGLGVVQDLVRVTHIGPRPAR
jgi:hypothetical protein